MKEKDRQGFFADRSTLDMQKYLVFEYYFETDIDPEEAAAHLCQEQSTAQWKRVDVDEDLRDQFGAKVIAIEDISELAAPSFLPPADSGRPYSACRVKIAHPHGNFGPRLPNILTAACGEGAFFRRAFQRSNCWTSNSRTTFWNTSKAQNSASKASVNFSAFMTGPYFLG